MRIDCKLIPNKKKKKEKKELNIVYYTLQVCRNVLSEPRFMTSLETQTLGHVVYVKAFYHKDVTLQRKYETIDCICS